jgi:hypothetical protein
VRTVREHLQAHAGGTVQEVNLCNLDARTALIFQSEAERQLGCSE